MTTTATLAASADLGRLGTLRASARQDPQAAMQQVSREFEALFVQMMLKAAREATPEGGLFDSHAMRFYQEMFDSQVALTMAEQGQIGFSETLARQLGTEGEASGTVAPEAAPTALELPARRDFPLRAMPYVAAPEPAVEETPLVDITRWARPQSAFAVPMADKAEVGPHQQRFLEHVREHAVRAADRLGTSPEVLIAQAALETGWGRHVVGGNSHNLFSIKADPAWEGRTVTQRTLEVFGGKPVRVSAAFRAYDDLGQAFDDYVDFIRGNPRYGRAIARAADPRAYVQELQRAGYATDPRYAQKILQIHARLAGAAPDRG